MNILQEAKAFCPACGQRLLPLELAFLLDGESGFHCPCGVRVSIATCVIHPLSPRLLSVEAARGAVWYHATLVKDWHNVVVAAGASVHVGEEAAAWETAVSELIWSSAESIYLWEVEVQRSAAFAPLMVDDVDDDAVFTRGAASLYMNRYEAPGSAALFIPASELQPLSVRVVPRWEVLARPSLYLV